MMATADLIDPRAVAAFEQIESDIATITAKLATPPTNLMRRGCLSATGMGHRRTRNSAVTDFAARYGV